MSTPTEIEARCTVVDLIRAKINQDDGGVAGLVTRQGADDALELMRALEGWACAMHLTTTTGSLEPHPVFLHISPAADAAAFDSLVDYIVRHLEQSAREAGKTPEAVLDALALAALEWDPDFT